MDKSEIIERLKSVLSVVLDSMFYDVSTISAETSLKDDLGLESIDMLDLIMTAETTFNVKLNMADAKNVNTLNDLADFILSQLDAKNEE